VQHIFEGYLENIKILCILIRFKHNVMMMPPIPFVALHVAAVWLEKGCGASVVLLG